MVFLSKRWALIPVFLLLYFPLFPTRASASPLSPESCKRLFIEDAIWNPSWPSSRDLLVAKLSPELLGKLGLEDPQDDILDQALKEAAHGYTAESLLLSSQGAQIAHTLFDRQQISLHQLTTANMLRLIVDEFSDFDLKLRGVPFLKDAKPTPALKLVRQPDPRASYRDIPLSMIDEKKLIKSIKDLPFSEQQYWEIEIGNWPEYVKSLNDIELNLLWQSLGELSKIVKFQHPAKESPKMILRLPSIGFLAAYLKAFSCRVDLDAQPMYSPLESLDVVRVLHTKRRVVAIHHPALNPVYEAHGGKLRPLIFLLHDLLHWVGGGHRYFPFDSLGLKTLLHFYEIARSFNRSTHPHLVTMNIFRIGLGFGEFHAKLIRRPTSRIVVNRAWRQFEATVGASKANSLWQRWFQKFEAEIGDLVIYSVTHQSSPQDIIYSFLIANNPLDEPSVNIFASQMLLTHLWQAPELWQQLGISGQQEVLDLQERLKKIKTPYPDVELKAEAIKSFIEQLTGQ